MDLTKEQKAIVEIIMTERRYKAMKNHSQLVDQIVSIHEIWEKQKNLITKPI